MRTFLAMTLVLLLALAGARADSHCPAEETTLTLETPTGTFYVINEMCQPECLFSLWIFMESNGEPGLQRCGDFPGDDRSCCEGIESDTILF